MFGRFNGFIFLFLLFISSLYGAIFLIFPFVPLAYISPRLWRVYVDYLVGFWLIFPVVNF